MDFPINYLAVLVCGLINMAVGSLWYGPLFGKPWMKLVGIDRETIKKEDRKGMWKIMIVQFLLALLQAYVLVHFVTYLQANTFGLGLQAGLWAWIGFTLTTMAGGYLFLKKSPKLFAIDVLYPLVVLMINGGILAVWR